MPYKPALWGTALTALLASIWATEGNPMAAISAALIGGVSYVTGALQGIRWGTPQQQATRRRLDEALEKADALTATNEALRRLLERRSEAAK